MKILLLGSGGYFGGAIGDAAQSRGWRVFSPSLAFTAYTHPESMVRIIGTVEPDVVINSAVFINHGRADYCEDKKSITMMSNALFPASLVGICCAYGIHLVQISTGCIFNGDNGGDGFREYDVPNLSIDTGAGVYISSKMLAEQFVRQCVKHLICRIRLPFDEFDNPRNYLSKLMTYPKILDAKNSLSNRVESAHAICELIDKKAPFGTYHVVNPGAVWAHEIVSMIKEMNGASFWKPEFWSAPEFEKVSRTPRAECILNTDKLQSVGIKMTPLKESLRGCIKNWKNP